MNKLKFLSKKFITLINKDTSFEDETKELVVVLRTFSFIICIYFIVFAIIALCSHHFKIIPMFIPWLLLYVTCFLSSFYFRKRMVFHIGSIITLSWIIYFNILMGWDCGVQHFMFPLLLISFFATYDNFSGKLIYTFSVFCLRIVLYFYTKLHAPLITLPTSVNAALQILNTSTLFIIMFFVCWIYSQTNQANQAKLALYNERLKYDASTDTLTGLLNRRSMYELLKSYTDISSRHFFSIAMGDIDFFKKVNDQNGHECGDAVLKAVANYLKDYMQDKGTVCRWGGEEFLFLFPDTNGDQATSHIFDINEKISYLPIVYNDETLHITMTFGVEEYDFHSSSSELIKRADDKLYLGKEQGRNTVIY